MKMILEERAAAAAGLTEGDKKALDFIVANKKSACFLSSYEIAARIGTSPSTVVRLSKKLGYGSFAAFRRALQAEVAGAEGPTLAARSAKTAADERGGRTLRPSRYIRKISAKR